MNDLDMSYIGVDLPQPKNTPAILAVLIFLLAFRHPIVATIVRFVWYDRVNIEYPGVGTALKYGSYVGFIVQPAYTFINFAHNNLGWFSFLYFGS